MFVSLIPSSKSWKRVSRIEVQHNIATTLYNVSSRFHLEIDDMIDQCEVEEVILLGLYPMDFLYI